MKTAFTGFIEAGVLPYTIIDTEVVATTEQEGLAFFDSSPIGLLLSTTSVSNNNGNELVSNLRDSIANPWLQVDGFDANTSIEYLKDYGFVVHANGSSTTTKAGLTGDGVVPLYYKYTASNQERIRPVIGASARGAIGINLNPGGIDMGAISVTKWIYGSGVVRLKISFSTTAATTSAYLQIQDGSVFFFTTHNTISPAVNAIGSGSFVLNYIGRIEPKRIYCMRATSAVASGTIYNPAGGVAPNCSVMAFNRTTGRLVGKTKSNDIGAYTMLCVARKGDQLFMVCLDDDGVAPDFDAQVFDRIQV